MWRGAHEPAVAERVRATLLESTLLTMLLFCSFAWMRAWIIHEADYIIDKSLYPDLKNRSLIKVLWYGIVSLSFVWVGIALLANTLYRSVSMCIPLSMFGCNMA